MKMKVSELDGATLDYWVAKAEGATRVHIATDEKGDFAVAEFTIDSGTKFTSPYFPSTQWSDGGPILARMIESGEFCVWENYECVTVSNHDPEGIPCKEPSRWDIPESAGRGPTLLIAMCRASVVSKFGEEVAEE